MEDSGWYGVCTNVTVAAITVERIKALATLVLLVEPSLLYLIGDTEDPNTVWKLSHQFCKKSWANKLDLRQKLHSLKLKSRDSVQEHILLMTELYSALAGIDLLFF